MIKKLVRHGNNRALVIDKPVLELLGLGEDAEFEISTDGTSLLMTPLRQYDAAHNTTFELAAEEATVRYGSVFRRLAR